ncbi:MAG: sulfotransferase [Pseudomonadota bacterium]
MSQAEQLGQNYSKNDRMVHKIATGQLDLQKLLSGLEDRLFARKLRAVTPKAPIFVTSLPRAGTTLLLEVLAEEPDLVAHSYRHMPFLLCPLLWDKLSSSDRKAAVAAERAHGDGMLVSYDSVEAFEELIWKAFYPEHFRETRIVPWTEKTLDDGFSGFLRMHMAKLIVLDRKAGGAASRYVSKNNANIARLAWIRRQLTDAVVLIPYRAPEGHIRSMLRQHRQFLESHKIDPFTREYMESIGHLEFGEAHRPINFGGWLKTAKGMDSASETYWATYWCQAMEAVLDVAKDDPGCHILSYDRLCSDPDLGLERIAELTGLGEARALRAQASRFRAPTSYQAEPLDVDADLADRIAAIAARLGMASVI